SLHAARAAGRPVDVEVSGIAADSLGARRVGSLMYPIAERHVADVVLVDDEAITEARRLLWDRLRIAAEPGGAAALAALVSGAYRPATDERVGIVICGGNADAPAVTPSSQSTAAGAGGTSLWPAAETSATAHPPHPETTVMIADPSILAVLAAAFIAATVGGFSGFGAGLVIIPPTSAILGPTVAAAVFLVV